MTTSLLYDLEEHWPMKRTRAHHKVEGDLSKPSICISIECKYFSVTRPRHLGSQCVWEIVEILFLFLHLSIKVNVGKL